jgi:hypothetical protein
VQAVVEHRSYRIDDMSTDTRWPRFAAAAHAHGVRSMLGYRLFTSGRTLGALDLYSSKLNAFNAESEVVGELFAAHAAIALIGSTQQAEWKTALNSRDTIGMAKGILMHRERLTEELAFTLLVSASQKANIKNPRPRRLVSGRNQRHRAPTRVAPELYPAGPNGRGLATVFISVEGQHNPSGAPQSARRTRARRGGPVGTPPKGMARDCLPRVLRWG